MQTTQPTQSRQRSCHPSYRYISTEVERYRAERNANTHRIARYYHYKRRPLGNITPPLELE